MGNDYNKQRMVDVGTLKGAQEEAATCLLSTGDRAAAVQAGPAPTTGIR
jgi:hypothetical protein